ncbi:MAG: DNA gyrase C-terminal beta-propeller domain-containing protein, partial [Phycicoccus sp.]
RLRSVFDLSDAQAEYILELQLRRLTRFSRIELENERDELRRQIEELEAILGDEALLRRTVSDELADVAKAHGTPRRTVLLESAGTPATSAAPLEVADDPCWVLLSSTGLLARTSSADPVPADGPRAKHDAIVGAVRTTARGEFGLVTSRGRMVRMPALELPTLPPLGGAPALSGGAPLAVFVDLARGEEPLTIAPLDEGGPGLALGTAHGVVKRVTADHPSRASWEILSLREGDVVVGAAPLRRGDEDLVFVTSDAQLLRFPASSVRPQGRAAGGMAGIRLAPRSRAVFFGAVDSAADNVVVTSSGSADALPGTQAGSLKVAPYGEYPAKGRATGGVRAHRFLRGEDTLVLAWVGARPVRASGAGGVALELPEPVGRRDGSGSPFPAVVAGIGGPVS